MKYTGINKIRDYLRNQNISLVEDRVFNLKAKETPIDNYIILTDRPYNFWAVQNMDLLQVEIYWVNWWPDVVWEIADNILDIIQKDWLDFDWFRTFSIVCTWQTPTLTIENKFKITMMFQVRYLK